MSTRDLNRGSGWLFLVALAIALLGFAFPARGDTQVVICTGRGEATHGPADRFSFVCGNVELDLLIPRTNAWATVTAGKGNGDFGKAKLFSFSLGLDVQPTRWDGLKVGGGYRLASALLEDLDLGVPGLSAIGVSEQYLSRVSLTWEDVAIGFSWTHLWSSPAPEKAVGNDVCGRWAMLQVCGSWTDRPAPFPDGSSWSAMLLYEPGVKIELPWKRAGKEEEQLKSDRLARFASRRER